MSSRTSRARGWSSDLNLSFLQKLLCPTDWVAKIVWYFRDSEKYTKMVIIQRLSQRQVGQKVRGAGDLARGMGAGCDRRPSSSSQGGQICSLNTSRPTAGMPATCRLLGSQVGDAGGLEGFSLAQCLPDHDHSDFFQCEAFSCNLRVLGWGWEGFRLSKDQWPKIQFPGTGGTVRGCVALESQQFRLDRGGLLQKLSQST